MFAFWWNLLFFWYNFKDELPSNTGGSELNDEDGATPKVVMAPEAAAAAASQDSDIADDEDATVEVFLSVVNFSDCSPPVIEFAIL